MVKKGFLMAGCKACGWQGDLDNAHKLVKFIITNPPGSEAAGFTIANKKASKLEAKRATQSGKKKKKDDDSDEEEDEDDDDDSDSDGDAEKKEKKKEKKKKEKGDDDDEDDEAKAQKKKEKKEAKKAKKEAKKKAKGDDDDSDDDDSVEDKGKAKKDGDDDLEFTDELIVESTKRLAKFVKEQEGKGKLGKDKFFDEARMIQIQNAYSTKLRMYVALQSLFGDDMNKEGIKSRLPHLKALASTPQMSAGDILAAFELYYVTSPKLIKQYPMVLKEIYDADIVSEQQLLKHYDQDLSSEGFADAKTAAKPFLEWLRNADDDSDDDEDDDEKDGDKKKEKKEKKEKK